jgi:hypothetical protein
VQAADAAQSEAGKGAETMLTDNEKIVLLNAVIDRARADLNDGKPLTEMAHDAGVEQRILTAIKQDQRLASLTVVRAAIADVLDVGPPSIYGRKCYWLFDHEDEGECESKTRAQFIDAICQRITQLQQPPHNMDGERSTKERL